MALIRMNHLSFCKGRQTDVSVILPTKGMEDKRNGTSFETPGMKYQTLWLLHGGGGDDMDFVKYSNDGIPGSICRRTDYERGRDGSQGIHCRGGFAL